MIRVGVSILAICLLFVLAAPAADIDGKWTADVKMPQGKDKQPVEAKIVFDLKAEGSKLTGSVTTTPGGRRDMRQDITDGKIDGNKVSFATVAKTKKGEMKNVWEGTVSGNELTIARKAEGQKGRGLQITAKKN